MILVMINGYRNIIILACATVLILFYLNSNYNSKPKPRRNEQYVINTIGCKILRLDPYHLSLLPQIVNYSRKYLKCFIKNPLVISGKNFLKLNTEANLENINCNYKTINRQSENQNRYGISMKIDYGIDINISEEFVKIECKYKSNRLIYQDFIPFIIRKPQVDQRCEKILKNKVKKVRKQLNVLILGLDSVSKNSYVRHLHQVDRLVRQNLTFAELHGYNKIGLNTYPNMVSFNTGNLESEFPFDHKTTDLNQLPLVWQTFANNGYRTLHAEDCPDVSTFNYHKFGFGRQPTDYYMRPFAWEFHRSELRKKARKGCFAYKPEAEVILDWVADFFDEFAPDPVFAYVFLTRLSHDDYNTVAHYDKPISQFLRRLQQNGHLNRTIVLFFSDHGFRFGKVGKTYVGITEEKTPFFFFLLPSWFPKVFPVYYRNMKVNERRLVTPLDVHATLMDVANEFESVETKPEDARSVSLLTPISGTRTCAVAKIKSVFCACFRWTQISVVDENVAICAQLLVDYVNAQISRFKHICAHLSLAHIVEAREHSVKIKSGGELVNYLITFTVRPSEGLFRGVVLYNSVNNGYEVENSVDRINLYGNQSYCVADAILKPFCYCF